MKAVAMSERALILAFCGGLIPMALLSLCIVSLLGSWCTKFRRERDAWKKAYGEMESQYVGAIAAERTTTAAGRVEVEEALVGQMAHIARLEAELVEVRRRNRAVHERISRVVRDLKQICEAWIRSRRLTAEASAQQPSTLPEPRSPQ